MPDMCLIWHPSHRTCCPLSVTQIPVLSWLLLAFILSQEISSLFQKVFSLIATTLLLSMSTKKLSLPSFLSSLDGSQLAAFFHQASVRTYLQHVYISCTKDKGSNTKDLQTGGLTDMNVSSSYLRVAPEKLLDLAEFVNNFFQNLPSFTIICTSLLEGDFVNLGEDLHREECPIVMLFLVDATREENQDDAISSLMHASENKEFVSTWECPWGCTLTDYVLPSYKVIQEKNFLLMKQVHIVHDDNERKFLWWEENIRFNSRLSVLLRTIEDSWLGPWSCLLLGGFSDFKQLDIEVSKLSSILRSKSIVRSTTILKAILGGCTSFFDVKACISQMCLYKGYLGRGGCCQADRFTDGGSKSLSKSTNFIWKYFRKRVRYSLDREPIVLVLDAKLQILPWENIPILRKQEVYRMPSMISIFTTLGHHLDCEQTKGSGSDALFRLVDPLDLYYLIDPSQSLARPQLYFKEYANPKWKGEFIEAVVGFGGS